VCENQGPYDATARVATDLCCLLLEAHYVCIQLRNLLGVLILKERFLRSDA
jgi:hypothetical protein